jgi:two-component system, OmpR family, sensor kinase
MKCFQSIRWRVQLWHSVLLAVIVSILGTLFYFHEKEIYLDSIDARILSILPLLPPRFSPNTLPPGPFDPWNQNHHGRSPHIDLANHTDAELTRAYAGNGLFYAVWTGTTDPPILSKHAPQNLQMVKGIRFPGPPKLQTRDGNREAVAATPDLPCIIAGMKLETLHAELHQLAGKIILGCLAVVACGIAVGWWLTGRVTRPFSVMHTVAARVAAGELDARIPVPLNERGETAELAQALNDTFAQLEQSFGELRRFTADASHELRTPITAALAETQVALRKERDASQYREALTATRQNLCQLKDLAEALLDLSQLDAHQTILGLTDGDVCDLAKQALEELSPAIATADAKITFEGQPTPLRCDPVRIRRAITNLVANAIQHSPKGVSIRITTRSCGHQAQIEVADNGPGISSENLPHIFQRFYRGTDARKQSRPGAGLGLAIVQSIVKLHQGTIEVKSKPGQGTQFIIKLPTGR